MKVVKLFNKYDVLRMDYDEFWDVWMKGKKLYIYGFYKMKRVNKGDFTAGYVPTGSAFPAERPEGMLGGSHWDVTSLGKNRVQVRPKNGAKLVD